LISADGGVVVLDESFPSQQCLNFLPLPQLHESFLPGFTPNILELNFSRSRAAVRYPISIRATQFRIFTSKEATFSI
jgi:hypothetical protein